MEEELEHRKNESDLGLSGAVGTEELLMKAIPGRLARAASIMMRDYIELRILGSCDADTMQEFNATGKEFNLIREDWLRNVAKKLIEAPYNLELFIQMNLDEYVLCATWGDREKHIGSC